MQLTQQDLTAIRSINLKGDFNEQEHERLMEKLFAEQDEEAEVEEQEDEDMESGDDEAEALAGKFFDR